MRDVAVWRWGLEGEAFGNDAPEQDPDQDGVPFVFDLRFPGQRYDAASGLVQNYYREYEALTGRYTQSDPIGLSGGISTYGYASGTPLSMIDPTGELALVGALIGGGIEVASQAYKNYRMGCDMLDIDNYDLWDIGIATATGAFAPGLINVGKTAWKSRSAIRAIRSQSANTAGRAAKNAGRIAAHKQQIKDIVLTQASYQAGKTAGKALNGNACGCGE